MQVFLIDLSGGRGRRRRCFSMYEVRWPALLPLDKCIIYNTVLSTPIRCTSSRRSTIWSPRLSEHGAMETTCGDMACTATALKCGQPRLVDHAAVDYAANDGVHMRLAATRRRSRLAATRRRSRHAPNVRDDMRQAASRRRKQNVFYLQRAYTSCFEAAYTSMDLVYTLL
jgi:hypothetical protein